MTHAPSNATPSHDGPSDDDARSGPSARTRGELVAWLDALLEPSRFRDYAPNGLQVEGRDRIERVVTGVTANLALIEAAIERGAHAILVHHGMFWDRELRTLTGWKARRVRALFAADINLIAYHLPLDAHPEVGNNAVLLRTLGVEPDAWFGGSPALGAIGDAPPGATADGLAAELERATGQRPLVFLPNEGSGGALVRRVGVVTGGGASFVEEAHALGVDLFVTGEPAENSQALAAELGIAVLAGGHHATERFGPRALGERLAAELGLAVTFVDVTNPA